jgi:putative oxidoreductase
MKDIFNWLRNPPTEGPKSTIALRLMAGSVFFWEGILKFVYANQGFGRFTKLGMPLPHFTADFVACLEIVGGLLVLSGWSIHCRDDRGHTLDEDLTLLGHPRLSHFPRRRQRWVCAVLHEVRSEYAQLLTVVFLMINGPGKWSLDAVFNRKQESRSQVVAASRRKESANASVMV